MTRSMELDVVGDSLRLPQSSVDEREGHTDPATFSDEHILLFVCFFYFVNKS